MEDRVKPLSGVRNFRDFGGYATQQGGRVAVGRLFRAGHFHEATDDDKAFVDGLGIEFQLELRRPIERERQPNKWAPAEIIFSDGGEDGEGAHIAYLQNEDVTPDSAHGFMVDYYRDAPFVDRHVELYRKWFDRLARTDGAALVNCAAGKDRTGICCALTLMVLGVDQDTAFEDYILTNQAVDMERRIPEAQKTMEAYMGRTLDASVMLPFMGVHEDYLHTALNVMTERHGGAMAYVEDVLGVDAAAADALRARFVA